MSEIADFLLARIAEDERLLEREDRAYGGGGEVWTSDAHARVQAECEAKRRIVELHSPPRTRAPWRYRSLITLQTLAAIYADHPDYQQAWRP